MIREIQSIFHFSQCSFQTCQKIMIPKHNTKRKNSFSLTEKHSVFSIWCMRLHTHTPAHTPLVWCVQKIAHATCLWNLLSGTFKQTNWNLIVDHFSLTFTSMYDFRIRENFLVRKILSPEAYLEPSQASKMMCFAKIVNG